MSRLNVVAALAVATVVVHAEMVNVAATAMEIIITMVAATADIIDKQFQLRATMSSPFLYSES